MKKNFIFLILAIFSFPLSPVDAITNEVINATVQIVCPDNYGNFYSGSGTVIDPKGIILTNKHVVTDGYGNLIQTCVVGFLNSINEEPAFKEGESFNLAEVKYYTTTDDMDVALLYLDNKNNRTYPYINVWNSNSNILSFGDKIEVVGFPSIGGSTITYTSGDFSGYGGTSVFLRNYLKTAASVEHGNSGGGAYLNGDQFIGIPTMVVRGTLNSMSYILSINSIKNWFSNLIGKTFQKKITEQQPTIQNPQVVLNNDLTPPDISKVNVQFYDCSKNFGESLGLGWRQSKKWPLYPEDCVPIPYDIKKYYNVKPEDVYYKIDVPVEIINSLDGWAISWEPEILSNIFLEKKDWGETIKEQIINSLRAKELYKIGQLNYNEEGRYFLKIRLFNKNGGASETGVWQYNYQVKESKLTGEQFCEQKYGAFSIFLGKKNTKGIYMCDCKSGHSWSKNKMFCQKFLFKKTLQIGSTGEDVKQLQGILKERGYYKNKITNYFGNATKSALMKFQTDNELIVDGKVGPKIKDFLNNL